MKKIENDGYCKGCGKELQTWHRVNEKSIRPLRKKFGLGAHLCSECFHAPIKDKSKIAIFFLSIWWLFLDVVEATLGFLISLVTAFAIPIVLCYILGIPTAFLHNRFKIFSWNPQIPNIISFLDFTNVISVGFVSLITILVVTIFFYVFYTKIKETYNNVKTMKEE